MHYDAQKNKSAQDAQNRTTAHIEEAKNAAWIERLKQYFRSEKIILADEKPEEFDHILTAIEGSFSFRTAAEYFLVQQMALAQWRLQRARRREMHYALLENQESREVCDLLDRVEREILRWERSYLSSFREMTKLAAAREKSAQDAARRQVANPHGVYIRKAFELDSDNGERETVDYPAVYFGEDIVEWPDLPPVLQEKYFPGWKPSKLVTPHDWVTYIVGTDHGPEIWESNGITDRLKADQCID